MSDRLVAALQKFYAMEINVTIESDWDAGFTVAIGNHRNGFVEAEHFHVQELDRAAEWLEEKAASSFLPG